MTGLTIVCCLIAFVVGGIPFGYLVGRLVLKDDIRNHGSGNIGATNVTRIIGWKWGSVVLVLDALKGLLPTLGTKLLLESRGESEHLLLAQIAVGVCAIVGHMYPVWLKLRGGKGIATALGVILVIAPIASAVSIATFAVLASTTQIIALASIAATSAFAVTQLTLLGRTALDLHQIPLTFFSILMPALIIWRHRSNILRLWRGQEHRITDHSDHGMS